MAALRCSYLVVLLTLFNLSVCITADSLETTVPAGHHATGADNPQTSSEIAGQNAEQPMVEERRWEATEVEDGTPDDAPADKQETSSHETVGPSTVAQPKDDFQEELVIRPLHSGDIYASFQFRTLWETDFRGNKGKLTVSTHEHTIHSQAEGVLICRMVVECICKLSLSVAENVKA